MNFEATGIPECYLIDSFHHQDERGGFVKTFHSQEFDEKAFTFDIKEIYYTWSEKNVFRGFHFQSPPHAHSKIVFCNFGGVIDYIVDLRKGSEVYGKVFSFELNEGNRQGILIPKGCAHGFYVPEEKSMLTYLVETEYAPDYDMGLLWSTFNHDFNFDMPLTSERDAHFDSFENFKSPFE